MSKALRVAGWTMIVLGAIVLEFAVYEVFGTSLANKGHQQALRQEFREQRDDPVVGSPSSPPIASGSRPRNPRAIARLRIPTIDVDVIVVEGTRLSDLAHGPGRYRTSAPIGSPGSTAIAGHRTGWGSPFLNMDKVGPGDTITLETPDGTRYVYRVTGRRIVGPNEAWVLKGNPDSAASTQLTLTTCDPKYTSRNRLIVWADLANTEGRA